MDERMEMKGHKLVLQNRKGIQVSGVNEVISFDANEIILETTCGLLLIKGEELHMSHLTLEKGEVEVDGMIDSLVYSEVRPGAKKAENLIGRLFK